jgi:hypothetical protein
MALEFDTIIDGVDPGRVYIGGEIRAAGHLGTGDACRTGCGVNCLIRGSRFDERLP